MYLLPAIDILDGKAVRLAKGDYDKVTVYAADPVQKAREFEEAGARWLHVVDLDGAKAGAAVNIGVVERILAQTSLKVEVGGGIRSMDTLARLADAGAHRMVLGTALVRDREFARAAVEAYGDRVACGLDARDGEVAVDGWTEGAGIPAVQLAAELAGLGYRHMVYTDIARDGMQTGIDEGAYRTMAAAFGHPVVASGGVAGIDDLRRLAALGPAVEGVIAGRALYEGSLDLPEALAVCAQTEGGEDIR